MREGKRCGGDGLVSKELARQLWGHEFNPQHPCKYLGAVAHAGKPALRRKRQVDPKCFLASQPSWVRLSEKLVWKYKMNRNRWRHPVSITGLNKLMHIYKNMYTDTHTNKCKIDKNKMTAMPLYTIISRDQCHTHSYNWLKCFPSKDCLQLSLVQPWLSCPRQVCRVGSRQIQSASPSPNSPDYRMQFWLKPYSPNSARRGTCSSKTITE